MGISEADRRKKAKELAQFRRVIETSPCAFPAFLGEPNQPCEPAADIGLRIANGSTYGIEITQLLRPEGLELAVAREKLIDSLWEWSRANAPNISVDLRFAPVALPRTREALAQVVDLIGAYLGLFNERRGPLMITRDLPAFLAGVGLFPSVGSTRPAGGGVFHVPALTSGLVAQCIARKGAKMAGYRAHADAVALPIYCPMSISQAQLAVPADASTWVFDMWGFERVVLYAADSNGIGLMWQ
jgi:hypothetical protein